MAKVDLRLTDPSPAELVQALGRATCSANGNLTVRRVDHDRAFWQRFVRRIARQPEGLRHWAGSKGEHFPRPAARVIVAWWSDYLGRRHYRVLSRQEKWYPYRQELVASALLSSPPLCLLSPERTLLRHRDGRNDLLVVCPCGTCGTPKGIAWMGNCCGACHDRREEASLTPDCGRDLLSPGRNQNSQVSDLHFSSDGRVVFSRGHNVFQWDPASGASQKCCVSSPWHSPSLVMLPDGSGSVTVTGSGTVWEHDFGTGEKRVLHRSRAYLRNLALTPDGNTLYVGGQGNLLLDRATSAVRPVPALDGRQVLHAAFAGNRDLFACDWNGNVVHVNLDRGELRTVARGPEPPPRVEFNEYDEDYEVPAAIDRFLAVSPDGRRLVYTEGRDSPRFTVVWEIGTERWWRAESGRAIWLLTFAPDNRTLAGVDPSGALTLWDTVARQEIATFTWPGRGVSGLAVAPDGATLATGHGDGSVQLWPWRSLLEAR